MVGWIEKNEKNRWMVGWIEKIYEKNMDGWMDKKNEKKDGWLDGQKKKKNRWMVGWIEKIYEKNGWLDG